ncbi:MAG: hypothetical protein AAGF86_21150 [Pseudomonadota bacterium]
MTPYGLSLLASMGLAFLPWSFLFEALGKVRVAPRIPLGLAAVTLLINTYLYAGMLIRFAPEGRGWVMITFLTLTIHVGTIALGGLVWAIIGQRAARGFLNAPLIFLILAFAATLCALVLSFTFTPTV